jgi:RNA polymerase sigma factor (sigma-70 family)
MDRGERPERNADPLTRRFLALSERLAGTAYFVLGHREDAREAVQEAFVRCWRARESGNGADDVDAWIFSVVLNTAKDLRRRLRVRAAASLPAEDAMRATAIDPGAALDARDALERVRGAIHELPDDEREVFLLRQNGELSFEAIARTLQCPVGTAKTRMRAALKRLRAAIEAPAPAMSPNPKGRIPCR